jgi:glycogen debranching enzyme
MTVTADALDAYYIVAATDGDDPETRLLKQGETFAVFDVFGDITGKAGQGLYHDGTRHLSAFRLRLNGQRPFLLGSSPDSRSHVLRVDLTNPDMAARGEVIVPRGALHVRKTTVLWRATCFVHLTLTNHGQEPIAFDLEAAFENDFRDLFEIRGARRAARGTILPVRYTEDGMILGYVGLDGVTRQTIVQIEPAPIVDETVCRVPLNLEPGQRSEVVVAIGCAGSKQFGELRERWQEALTDASAAIDAENGQLCGITTSNELFNQWIQRSRADIAMMVTETRYGPYPYAGVPWFSTIFGRDGILTALSLLWGNPSLARGVLLSLAATQATSYDPARDAEPGKILHEMRRGEMAALGEVPFGAYYGSVDATPLFVLLAGRYYDRTGDIATIKQLWPHLEAALAWIDRDGDRDGDGFVEYARATDRGLVQQGWKDSYDSVFHQDGTLAEAPIALSEVQGYVYAARHHAAELASALGDGKRCRQLQDQAEQLHQAFEDRFWCEDLGTYALALDGHKRPCKVVSSNAVQCLISGIAVPERAARVAATALRSDMFSGWGLRTIRAGEARYNPMAYHNGSIWPHDTALAALGLARYDRKDEVVRLTEGLFGAAQQFELRRLPELFCGFTRHDGEPPTRYPTACAPQAWASASVFLLVQALLGIDIDARRQRVTLRQARLPAALDWLRVTGLMVGSAEIDVLCERRGEDAGVSVLRRSGDVVLVTEK